MEKKKDIPPKPAGTKAQAPETGKSASPPQDDKFKRMTVADIREREKLLEELLDCLDDLDKLQDERVSAMNVWKSRIELKEERIATIREKIQAIENPPPLFEHINKKINEEAAGKKALSGAAPGGLTSVKDAIEKAKAKAKKDKPAKAKKEPKKA